MYCRGGDENIESLLEQDASFYEFQRNYSPEESKSHNNLLVPGTSRLVLMSQWESPATRYCSRLCRGQVNKSDQQRTLSNSRICSNPAAIAQQNQLPPAVFQQLKKRRAIPKSPYCHGWTGSYLRPVGTELQISKCPRTTRLYNKNFIFVVCCVMVWKI